MAYLKESMRNFIVLFVILLLCPVFAFGQTGMVVGVTDGDTIKVRLDGLTTAVRLYGIDSPEKKQPFGQAARDYTALLVAGKTVTVFPVAMSFGRTVAIVICEGKDIQEAIVAGGYAWVYDDYCKQPVCDQWRQLQTVAANTKKGLWKGEEQIPPWEFRKNR